MSEPEGPVGLLAELRRRNVYKVGVSYLVAAFVIVQVADLATGAFDLPSWFEPMTWVVAAIGFPIALVLAWAYELGPGGVRRTPHDPAPGEGEDIGGRRRALATPAWLGLLGAAVVAGWAIGTAGKVEITDRSIAVLPFEATGGAEGVEFGRGLHDGLLTRLTNVADLTVKSRTSVERYGGSTATIPEIAREMEVAWLVEGAVHLAGDRVRVNATLINAQTDDRLWAREYDRDVTIDEIFQIQSDLAETIARSLQAQISPGELDRLQSRPTEDIEAYRLTVQGRSQMERRTESGLRQAVDLFEAAIARDSSYALAWSGLADARMLIRSFGYAGGDTLAPLAQQAVDRALDLDPDLAEAHTSRGRLAETYGFDAPTAHEEYSRAVELNSNYAPAFHWLASLEIQRGRPGNAIEPIERAAELDPFSTTIQNVRALVHWLEEGPGTTVLGHFQKAIELEPAYPYPYLNAAIALSDLGRHTDALSMAERGFERSNTGSFEWGYAHTAMAVVLARAGEDERAGEFLRQLREWGQDPRSAGEAPFWIAIVLGVLGDVDGAFAALDEVEWTAFLWWDLQAHPLLAPLRQDPRYGAVVGRVNRQWGLNPDGSLPER